MIKIFHISDTHCFSNQLTIPEGIDMVIHSGDCSNQRNKFINANEVDDFIKWYKNVGVKYKIYVAGNHDGSIEKRIFTKQIFAENGIIYLENESAEIDGFLIYGSPYCPSAPNIGDWSFLKKRDKLHEVWQMIPEDTDILITHSPPKGVLDLSEDREHKLEQCGCTALLKRIMVVKPKAHLFGHIHDGHGIINNGIRKYSNIQTIFSNASCVTDGRFDMGLTSQGNVIEIN